LVTADILISDYERTRLAYNFMWETFAASDKYSRYHYINTLWNT